MPDPAGPGVDVACAELALLLPRLEASLTPGSLVRGGKAERRAQVVGWANIDTHAHDTLALIETGLLTLERRVRYALGFDAHAERHSQSVTAALRLLPDLIAALPAGHALPVVAHRDLWGWHDEASRALGDVPELVTLRMPCPRCGGRLRHDPERASKGVWCVGWPAKSDACRKRRTEDRAAWCPSCDLEHPAPCGACGTWHGPCLDEEHRRSRWSETQWRLLRWEHEQATKEGAS